MDLKFHSIGTTEGKALLNAITPPVTIYTDDEHRSVIKRKGAHLHFLPYHNAIVVAKHNNSLYFRDFWNDDVLIMAIDGKHGFIECHFNGCKVTDEMFIPEELIEAEMA